MSLLSHYVEGHRAVHRHGDEVAWWEKIGIDPSADRYGLKRIDPWAEI
jgi:hypothetical protein